MARDLVGTFFPRLSRPRSHLQPTLDNMPILTWDTKDCERKHTAMLFFRASKKKFEQNDYAFQGFVVLLALIPGSKRCSFKGRACRRQFSHLNRDAPVSSLHEPGDCFHQTCGQTGTPNPLRPTTRNWLKDSPDDQ